ncbi:MAG: leucine-rich repeat domain-containing protein [Synergistaceae bacterium]|nr:leucine-rich repeat domain-containing protein [Synergistaceae bacterium]
MRKVKMIALAVSVMLAACVSAWGDVAINEANFPDAVFREYVSSSIDKNPSDGMLSDEEIADTTNIDVDSKNISSLKGIEYFTSLQSLACDYNRIISLDMSSNSQLQLLYCAGNQLTELDTSSNPRLQRLYCYHNQLAALDPSSNPRLQELLCYNNQLTGLNVSNNLSLEYMDCSGNQLTSLDVSTNSQLGDLRCARNNLTALDISSNSQLRRLYCDENNLTTLDLSSNTKLDYDDVFLSPQSLTLSLDTAASPYTHSLTSPPIQQPSRAGY